MVYLLAVVFVAETQRRPCYGRSTRSIVIVAETQRRPRYGSSTRSIVIVAETQRRPRYGIPTSSSLRSRNVTALLMISVY